MKVDINLKLKTITFEQWAFNAAELTDLLIELDLSSEWVVVVAPKTVTVPESKPIVWPNTSPWVPTTTPFNPLWWFAPSGITVTSASTNISATL